MAEQTNNERRSAWIPWAFVAFFVTIVSVNGVMAYFAVSTYSGLETPKTYAIGMKYNHTLEKLREQKSWGWQHTVGMVKQGDAENTVSVNVTLKDKEGKPLDADQVMVRLYRPVVEGYDQDLKLAPSKDGQYVVVTKNVIDGIWDVRVQAHVGDRVYQVVERILLK